MQLNVKYIFSIMLSLMFFQLQAQIQFAIKPGTKEIGRKDELQVSYEIYGTDNVSGFEPPEFTGWRLISGPVISSEDLTVNGVKTSLTRYIFYLAPKSTGKLKLPTTSIEAGNKRYYCSEVMVNVIKQDHAEGASAQYNVSTLSGQSPINQSTSEETTLKAGEDAAKKMRQNLYAKVVVNKKKVYVGEPILVEYKLYTRLKSSTRINQMDFKGCSVYEMTAADPQPEEEVINGKKFSRFVFRKVQLVPLQPGTLVIPQASLDNDVSFRSNAEDYRRKFYEQQEDRTIPFNVKTEPVSIEVVPLPKEAFNSAVGSFTISTKLKKDHIAANETNGLIVEITGSGNFKSVQEPEVGWASNMYHFDATETDSLDRFTYPLTGKRIYEIPFEVNTTGKFVVPSVSFSYFDPAKGNIQIIKSKELPLTVSGTKNNLQTSVSAVNTSASNIKYLYYIIPLIFGAGAFLLFRNGKKKPALITNVEEVKHATVPPKQFDASEKFNDLLLIQGDAEFYTKAGAFAREMMVNGKGNADLLQNVLRDCSTMLYTPLPTTSKKEVLEKLQIAIA